MLNDGKRNNKNCDGTSIAWYYSFLFGHQADSSTTPNQDRLVLHINRAYDEVRIYQQISGPDLTLHEWLLSECRLHDGRSSMAALPDCVPQVVRRPVRILMTV